MLVQDVTQLLGYSERQYVVIFGLVWAEPQNSSSINHYKTGQKLPTVARILKIRRPEIKGRVRSIKIYEKKWYFVTNIVLTYCEKKLF